MSFPNPFRADFWVMPEPPDNVVYLNTPHGRANAAQAARLLEEDRQAISIEEAFQDVLDAVEDEARATRRVKLAQQHYNRLLQESRRG